MFLIDFYGCDASIQFTLSEPQTIQISTDEYPEICGTGGEITTQIYGGVEPVSFSWIGPNSFNSNSSEIFDLESGNYELTINDANNCSSSQEIIIQSIEGPNSLIFLHLLMNLCYQMSQQNFTTTQQLI